MQNPENAENPFAGQGPVLLDIGGAIGALIVAMPSEAEGLEVEIRPAGATTAKVERRAQNDHASHDHHPDDHTHDHTVHTHDHTASPDHSTGPTHHPHVGVVARPGADGPEHCLVYPEVTEGDYELVPIPGDAVVMTAQVKGGVVTYTTWPEDGPRS